MMDKTTHKIKSNTRENDTIKRPDKQEMYESAANVGCWSNMEYMLK
jgi:hypothetical protein